MGCAAAHSTSIAPLVASEPSRTLNRPADLPVMLAQGGGLYIVGSVTMTYSTSFDDAPLYEILREFRTLARAVRGSLVLLTIP